jgi:hypothetical protein
MAENNQVVKKEAASNGSIVVNQIIVRPIDRSPKDIETWRAAHRQAESPFWPQRFRLYDLYEDVTLDGHLSGILEKRISQVRNKTLHFIKDGKRIEELEPLINSNEFRKLVTKIMESKFWGVSGVEFLPGKDFTFLEIPRKNIRPHLKLISKEQYTTTQDGWNYDESPWLFVVGDDTDLGLLLKCAPYALYKKGNLADWAQYIEIFGQPVRIAKYDAYDEKTKQELQQVLDAAGSSLALMIPKQADFDMKDGKQSNGDGKLQASFLNAMNAEMSVIVLGVTETTTSSDSSGFAQAETHSKQQKEIVRDDMQFTQNLLSCPKILNVLASYGFPVEGGHFEFEIEMDLNYLRMRKEVDDFVGKKVPIADDYYYDQYGVPKPENYEELRAKMDEQMALSNAAKMLSNKSNGVPPTAPAKASKKDKKKGKQQEEPQDQSDTLSLKEKFFSYLTDFFGQALKS